MAVTTVNLGRIGFVPQGEYNPTKAYSKLDVVSYNGQVYAAKEDAAVGIVPTNTAYWVLLIDNNGALKANAGIANAGKLMGVNDAGNIVPVEKDAQLALDTSMSVAGAAADAQAVGNELATKVDKETGKTLSQNDFTNALKAKLDAIEEGANNYVHPAYVSRPNALYKITVDNKGHVSAVSPVTSAELAAMNIYTEATQTQAGLMSGTDKMNLTSLMTNAGHMYATLDDITDALNAIYYNDVVVPNEYVTSVTQVDGKIAVTRGHMEPASVTAGGLMSATDKANLDALTAGMGGTSGGYATNEVLNNKIDALDYADAAVAGKYVSSVSETNGVIAVTREDFPVASTTQDGFMSKEDKAAVDTFVAGGYAKITDIHDEIQTLDVSDAPVLGHYVSAVEENDGLIMVTHTAFPVATDLADGFMSKEDKAALDALSGGAGGGYATKTWVNGQIAALDAPDTAVAGKYVSAVAEGDGIIAVTRADFPVASATQDGFMTKEDFAKMSSVSTGESVASKEYVDGKINALDVTDTSVAGKYVSAVSETDGKIAVTHTEFPAASISQAGFMSAVDFAKLSAITTSETIASTDDITDAINALDKADSPVADQYVTGVSETNGIITVSRSAIPKATTTKEGLMSKEDKEKLDNVDVTIAGTGNVITDITAVNGAITATKGEIYVMTSQIGTAATGTNKGVAQLDDDGKIPESQLPAYVSDIIEYSDISLFPTTGASGKIYVDTTTNSTYRWTGTTYVNIGSAGSGGLMLGTTSATAARGDQGLVAYTHAVDSARNTTAQALGFYKFSATKDGHVGAVTAVTKADISALDIATTDDIDALDAAEVGASGEYIQKIKQEDGLITATKATLDKTLAIEGVAPDSKAVGDAIADEVDSVVTTQVARYMNTLDVHEDDGCLYITLP